jgi:AP-3 complex subunit mu
LDSGGHPLTTAPNALRDIVLPPSLLNKLLSVAGANINSTINSGSGLGAAGGAFSSPIPWRKTGLKYASNEIYFDLVEELQAIVNKFVPFYVYFKCTLTLNDIYRHGVSLSSSVLGKMETNARLSGTFIFLAEYPNQLFLSSLYIRHSRASSIFLKSKYSV